MACVGLVVHFQRNRIFDHADQHAVIDSTSLSLKWKFGIFSSSSGRFTRPTSKMRGSFNFCFVPALTRMLDRQESEIELRDQLASGFGQFGSDRLRFLESRNVVAAEAAISADQTFADIQILLIRRHGLEFFASFDVRGVVPQEVRARRRRALPRSICGSGFFSQSGFFSDDR